MVDSVFRADSVTPTTPPSAARRSAQNARMHIGGAEDEVGLGRRMLGELLSERFSDSFGLIGRKAGIVELASETRRVDPVVAAGNRVAGVHAGGLSGRTQGVRNGCPVLRYGGVPRACTR